MIITLDRDKCRKCGVCIERMRGYCISEENGYPVFDSFLCNACRKCAAICPFQAIMVNGVAPERIVPGPGIDIDLFVRFLQKRRSIKRFADTPISRTVLGKIVAAAGFAPNQNKNIAVHVVTSKDLLSRIDKSIIRFVRQWHAVLFGFRPFTLFIKLFYKDIFVIRRKMEYGDFREGLYENTQAVVIASGDKSVAVTERSAHYVLATMMYMAEALGVGTCLMDSVYLALRTDRPLRKRLDIGRDVLGAMILGYSNERICNIPHGYEVETTWV